jgi:hypothetical protein
VQDPMIYPVMPMNGQRTRSSTMTGVGGVAYPVSSSPSFSFGTPTGQPMLMRSNTVSVRPSMQPQLFRSGSMIRPQGVIMVQKADQMSRRSFTAASRPYISGVPSMNYTPAPYQVRSMNADSSQMGFERDPAIDCEQQPVSMGTGYDGHEGEANVGFGGYDVGAQEETRSVYGTNARTQNVPGRDRGEYVTDIRMTWYLS